MASHPLPAIAAFARVAHHGSFTRAAAELDVSPSALSQSIRALEKRLGVRLLNRTTRRVALSEHGARFLDQVLPGLERIDAAFDDLDALRGVPSGRLRINLARVVALRTVLPRLADFQARYPQITLELYADDALSDLVAGGFDAGIRLGECLAREMVALPVSPPQELAVVASPAWLARHRAPRTPQELIGLECVRFRRMGTGRLHPWEFTQAGRDIEVDVGGRLIVNDGELARHAALAGIGLAQPLLAEVEADIARGDLVRLLTDYTPPFDGLYIYYPAREQLAPKLRVFVDFLREGPG
ncbi:LysR family transcriptional regulator [Stenotrophomonas mori]|uniref:LysR family transcriptional regulator n=1 Tax=Stenotrophomonas mori TaxID=2871096 RepID=A0ABT0SGX9_9GAMM|nr:LysR family transcriptional regulator [Stenotrophomonas mori]MCL7714532.1 LysR family transcriptional regulator [Stenotrophomonas mori]